MWDLPGSGIEPISPSLQGGFFTSKPPCKPPQITFTNGKVIFSHFDKVHNEYWSLESSHSCRVENQSQCSPSCESNHLSLAENFSSVQFSSVAQLCPTPRDPMNCSTPGLPVHQQLLEFTQTHIHRVGDAIQPSHPLSSPSPPALNPSKHQSLFQ